MHVVYEQTFKERLLKARQEARSASVAYESLQDRTTSYAHALRELKKLSDRVMTIYEAANQTPPEDVQS